VVRASTFSAWPNWQRNAPEGSEPTGWKASKLLPDIVSVCPSVWAKTTNGKIRSTPGSNTKEKGTTFFWLVVIPGASRLTCKFTEAG